MNNLKVQEIITRGYLSPSKLPNFDYVVNPYVGCPHGCIYCYAEFMKRFTNHNEAWGTFTDVKIRSTSVKQVNLQGKTVFLSSVTDCYNPLEKKYGLTRKIIEQLHHTGANITVLTKSALVLRDMDLFKKISNITVGMSLNSTDDIFRQQTEPFASSVLSRLHALKTLHENGIKTWIHMAPIFPEISDWKSLLEAAASFTDHFSFENLKLRYVALHRVLLFIAQYYPDFNDLYHQIYCQKDPSYWTDLQKKILQFCSRHRISARIFFSTEEEKP